MYKEYKKPLIYFTHNGQNTTLLKVSGETYGTMKIAIHLSMISAFIRDFKIKTLSASDGIYKCLITSDSSPEKLLTQLVQIQTTLFEIHMDKV